MTEEQRKYLEAYADGACDAGNYGVCVDGAEYDEKTGELSIKLEPDIDSVIDKKLNELYQRISDMIGIKDWPMEVIFDIRMKIMNNE